MTYKILIASDSFKGSADSLEVGQAIARGIRQALPQAQIQIFSVADGGEGTIAVFARSLEGALRTVEVLSPDRRLIAAQYFISQKGDFAVIETAQASGLTQVREENRHILQLSSYGTGQLIRDALDQGVKRIYLGLGGSAVNDMGLGTAQALGAVFLDRQGQSLEPLPAHFDQIAGMDLSNLDRRLDQTEITLLADVTNPLCGSQGASQIFGPQKGASPAEAAYLDRCLSDLADLIEQEHGLNLKALSSGGAAGGMGAGLAFFLKADIKSGIATILELIGFPQALAQADLVVTGEGRLDSQSLAGKVPIGIAQAALPYNIPVIALVGSSSQNLDPVYQAGLAGVFPIVPGPMTLEHAMADTLNLLTHTSRNAVTFYQKVKQARTSKTCSLLSDEE